MDPEVLKDPYSFYVWLREHALVHRNPAGGVYLVSRNEAARTACQSPDGMRVGVEGRRSDSSAPGRGPGDVSG